MGKVEKKENKKTIEILMAFLKKKIRVLKSKEYMETLQIQKRKMN